MDNTTDHPNMPTLSECTEQQVKTYLKILGNDTENLHKLVLQEVEKPLLAIVMDYTVHN